MQAHYFFFIGKLPKISQFVLEFNTIIVSSAYRGCSMRLGVSVLEERQTSEKATSDLKSSCDLFPAYG
jgi:hypothetical protein